MAGALIGYDPVRIAILRRRTDEAVDALRAVHAGSTDDELAASAIAVVLRTIRTLTDDLVPVLDRIAASTAMTGWEVGGPPVSAVAAERRARAGHPDGRRWATYVEADEAMLAHVRAMDDDELLAFLEEQSGRLGPLHGTPPDLDDERVRSMLAALGLEIRRRATVRPAFVADLTAVAAAAPIAVHAVLETPGDGRLLLPLARAMLGAPRWRAELQPALYDAGVHALLRHVASDPRRCLELLRDDAALAGIASWEALDVTLTRTVVRRGLLDAIVADPDRVADGYAVLRELTRLANGELDSGFSAGAARGVGDAFIGYVDTLAPAISDVSDRIIVPEAGDGFVLGDYDDLVDLLGAVVVDAEAQAAVGRAVGAHLDGAFVRIAAALDDGPIAVSWLTPSARLTRVVGEAIIAEGNERAAARAAEVARQQGLGNVVGFTSGVIGAVAPGAVGTGLSLILDETTNVLTSPRRSTPDGIPDLELSGTFTREAWFGMTAVMVRDPRARRGQSLGRVGVGTWRSLADRLDDVEAAPPGEREAAIARFDRYVRETVPALDAAVVRALDVAGVDDLRRDRSGGDVAG